MIISNNAKPLLIDFKKLMLKTDILLNNDAKNRENYYKNRSGKKLELDVYHALVESAKGTVFENTIHLISGASFPDIVANKFYGVEVKSTEKNHWTSIGSSILESTRIQSVERIYLTFGKLGTPIEFLSKPYEDCLSDIAVTHYPRYKIDMKLNKGETIFDKMGITYDKLRTMDNPIEPVSRYYKGKLKEGQTLWWATTTETEYVSPMVKLWNTLNPAEKIRLTAQGYALFPEIIGGKGNKKYQNFALWLAVKKGIINTNIRDQFSAGGKVTLSIDNKKFDKLPATFGHLLEYKNLIIKTIIEASKNSLLEYWNISNIENDRICQWCNLVVKKAGNNIDKSTLYELLKLIFL